MMRNSLAFIAGEGASEFFGNLQSYSQPSDDFVDDFSFDERQPFVAAQVRVGQLVLIESELVQDSGVNVAEMVAILDRTEADGIGRTHDRASLDAAAGQEHSEAEVVMVPAFAALGLR